jgi:NAD(P)-dependent dehydrogenase (short-subunit alcohol dehydrogenase family)
MAVAGGGTEGGALQGSVRVLRNAGWCRSNDSPSCANTPIHHEAYRQSKQANRMLTVALAARLAERGITVNACHPGNVSSR